MTNNDEETKSNEQPTKIQCDQDVFKSSKKISDSKNIIDSK